MSAGEQVAEFLRLAEADPRKTLTLATPVTQQVHAQRDFAAESVAERAIGIAAMHLADLDASVRHLRSAIRLADRAGQRAVHRHPPAAVMYQNRARSPGVPWQR